jgi:hypothetical protein
VASNGTWSCVRSTPSVRPSLNLFSSSLSCHFVLYGPPSRTSQPHVRHCLFLDRPLPLKLRVLFAIFHLCTSDLIGLHA